MYYLHCITELYRINTFEQRRIAILRLRHILTIIIIAAIIIIIYRPTRPNIIYLCIYFLYRLWTIYLISITFNTRTEPTRKSIKTIWQRSKSESSARNLFPSCCGSSSSKVVLATTSSTTQSYYYLYFYNTVGLVRVLVLVEVSK